MNQQTVSKPSRSIASSLLVAVAALLVSACSATGGSSGAPRLEIGASVAAPLGAVEFCFADRVACGIEIALVDADIEAEADAIKGSQLQATGGGAKEQVQADQMATDMAQEFSQRAAFDQNEHALLFFAEVINRRVNDQLTYMTDLEAWGEEEVWTLPLSTNGRAQGDCEDYALEKRALLLEAGVAPEQLSMATVWSEATGLHAVLVLRAQSGDYVLDNAAATMRAVNETPYEWIAIQTGVNLLSWAQVGSPSDQTVEA